MSQKTRVLVVEDEEVLRMALTDALESEGFEVLEAADGEAGLQLALREDPAIILLDVMLPKRDGFSVLRALREDQLTTPILILSARGEEWDRVQGFEYGADDYVVKPFSIRELLMRVRALLARSAGATPGLEASTGKVRFGEVEIDFAAYSLLRGDKRSSLSRRELDLLRYFLAHEGEVLDRLRLLSDVWGEDSFPTPRTVDTHVLKLRKKIELHPDEPRHIQTVHGVGYRFSKSGE